MYTHVWMKSQQVGIVKILLLRVTLELKKCLNYFYLQQKSGSFFRYKIHSLLATKADRSTVHAPGLCLDCLYGKMPIPLILG